MKPRKHEAKALILSALRNDEPLKSAYTGLASASAGSRWARELGYRKMFVTDEERAEIIRRRHASPTP